MNARSLLLSVVIPAYNEADRIADCLHSLARQRTTHLFEVIVVDNASTDDTADVGQFCAPGLRVRVLHEPRKGRGRARRTGWAAARGSIVFSTDADAILPPDWLERGVAAFTDPNIVAVTGPARIEDCGMVTNALYSHGLRAWQRCSRVLMLGYVTMRGANFAARKSAYDVVGGFDPQADAHEDSDLSFRIQEAGRIVYDPHMLVTVSGRRYRDGFLKGMAEYPRTFAERFVLGRRTVPLMDVR
jgi:glycosyltransferase involved in cell wall biosynthesis